MENLARVKTLGIILMLPMLLLLLMMQFKLLPALTEMEREGVVPDLIDEVPPTTIEVSYPSGAEVRQGNELTPTQVKDVPTIRFPADVEALYSFFLLNPDAPSRADRKYGEWVHWLVVNVPGDDVNQGEIIDDYIGSGPPNGTGLHRYVFLAYRQPDQISCDEPRHSSTHTKRRLLFRVRDFAQKYNLGQPVAGNFYQAQWDEYVPQLYAQINNKRDAFALSSN